MTATAIPRAGGPAAVPPGFAPRVFAAEAGKGLRLMWRRRAVMISGIVLNGFLYLMIQFFIGGGHLPLPVLALTLPGLFA
jgi:ABC-2 type transport system permease protein